MGPLGHSCGARPRLPRHRPRRGIRRPTRPPMGYCRCPATRSSACSPLYQLRRRLGQQRLDQRPQFVRHDPRPRLTIPHDQTNEPARRRVVLALASASSMKRLLRVPFRASTPRPFPGPFLLPRAGSDTGAGSIGSGSARVTAPCIPPSPPVGEAIVRIRLSARPWQVSALQPLARGCVLSSWRTARPDSSAAGHRAVPDPVSYDLMSRSPTVRSGSHRTRRCRRYGRTI